MCIEERRSRDNKEKREIRGTDVIIRRKVIELNGSRIKYTTKPPHLCLYDSDRMNILKRFRLQLCWHYALRIGGFPHTEI